jgi:predicted HicB family RNase H-like nuclease
MPVPAPELFAPTPPSPHRPRLLGVRLAEAEHDALSAQAEQEGRSLSDVVRVALAEHIAASRRDAGSTA